MLYIKVPRNLFMGLLPFVPTAAITIVMPSFVWFPITSLWTQLGSSATYMTTFSLCFPLCQLFLGSAKASLMLNLEGDFS
jgi:ABC-type nitrate/sulfonate/bicarbonate transport system permease component